MTEAEQLDWDRIRELVAEYRDVDVPCPLLPGERDGTFPSAMAHKLRAQLPRAWQHVLPGSGHSVQLETPGVVAAKIHDFIEMAGEGLPPVTDGVVTVAGG